MKFKDPRISTEFGQLLDKNYKLKMLLECVDLYCQLEHKQEITLTSIYRSEAENKAAGASSVIHTHWRAADISIRNFTIEQRNKVLAFCNQFSYPGTKGKSTAIIHAVAGGAPHLHVQYF